MFIFIYDNVLHLVYILNF